ncbi:hypothetical protein GW17_00038510 [Ensete ventricosum]|nr:hypothetical protein GW17_00038510 [Ensete ventricosum]
MDRANDWLWVFLRVLLFRLVVLFFRFFNRFYHEKPPLLQRWSGLQGSSQCRHKPIADLSRCSSLVNSFDWEGRLIVDGVEGLCVVDRVVTLVLRASWFSLSSCSCEKEIAAVIV